VCDKHQQGEGMTYERTIRRITLKVLGDRDQVIDEVEQMLWQSFQVSRVKAQDLMIRHANNPEVKGIGYYLNGEYYGMWVIDKQYESQLTFIPTEVYEEVS
jgi:hypothetical protein